MIALFKRLPILRWRLKMDEQIVPLETQKQFPDLTSDFAIMEQVLIPCFRGRDNESLHAQNRFRLEQLCLIFGGVISTTLGSIQAANANVKWPGIALAALASFLAFVSGVARELDSQKRFRSNRLKAEILRGEYFLFLGRIGNYANDADRVQNLKRRVADIEAED